MNNMRRILFLVSVLFLTFVLQAQDFSYLKDIDLNNAEEMLQAEEAAMECCCYLVAVRYDKKDIQRQYASSYIHKWIVQPFGDEKIVCDVITQITEDRKELIDMYLAFYVMSYLEGDRQVGKTSLRQEALIGVIEYCSVSSNKLKLTKEMKLIKQYHENGNVNQYLQDITLSSR